MTPASVTRIALLLASGAVAGCASTTASGPTPAAAPAAEARAPARERTASPARPASAPSPAAAAASARELSPSAKRLFDEAIAAEDQQRKLKVPTDWEELERRWRAVADAQPIPEAWFNVGVALERRGKVDEARQAYRRALSADAAFAPAAVNLARLEEPSDPREAARIWTDLRQRFPDEAVPRVRLAALYEAAGQLDEAWNLAREALLRDASATGAYKVMMRIALQRGRLDLAQLLAVKARKLQGADPEIESFLGDVHLRLDDEVAATLQWKKAIAIQDNFLPARYALLSQALSHRQWEAVAEQAQAILKASPDDARVRVVLGIAYRHLGQPDKALAEYDRADRGKPRVPELYLARGVALMKSKEQCDPAITELRRYISEAGPAVAADGPAPRLLRECEQIIVATRQAEEAAREMKAQAEREAARKAAAGSAAQPAVAGSTLGTAPNGSSRDRPDKGAGAPTR